MSIVEKPLNLNVVYVAYERESDLYWTVNGWEGCRDMCFPNERLARSLQRLANDEAVEGFCEIAWECQQDMNDDTFAKYQYLISDVYEASNSCLVSVPSY